MNINKYTEKARETLQNAQKLAVRMSHQQIDLEHILVDGIPHQALHPVAG